MGLNQNMNLVLSTDAKPRLKWTTELHQCFVEAVSQLGGPEKATPKSLMRAMGVPGLTLYHLKSHLQKHRLGKVQIIGSCNDCDQEDSEVQSQDMNLSNDETHNQNTECLHITQAWRMQIEVQRKLQEQIKVQRHLQLRIEAQGKYLQSVLNKAQETLAGYTSSPVGVEQVKTQLSHLASMVNSGCPSSESMRRTMCSMESSLTSSESCEHKEETHKIHSTHTELPLMDIYPSSEASWRKRNADTISDEHCAEKQPAKRSGWSGMLDLNRQYQNDADSALKTTDLKTRE